MAKYKVEFRAYVFATDTVEAEDESEAAEKAFKDGFPQLCASCSGWGQPWQLELSEDEAVWEVADVREAEPTDG